MAYDTKFLRVPEIHWLGMFPSDSEKYDIPQQCLRRLTAEGETDLLLPKSAKNWISFSPLLYSCHMQDPCTSLHFFSDKRRTEAMLCRCYLSREVPNWRLELEKMLQRGVKFEIEALSGHSLSYLSNVYITSKIQGRAYM